ncbi:MAG: YfhO family protein [Lachnospiraceae bacterium]|nr:YfhO family protein [Lachnospiraceae bacterium]
MLKKFKNNKYAFFISYSIIIAFSSLCCFWWFLYNHKTLIWKWDGLTQHYLAFLYCSRFFRQIVKTLITEHALVIPMWDMSIGFGSDVFTTMHYYGLGDPFTILTMFMPEAHLDKFFSLMYFIKLYIAGWGSTVFVRHHGVTKKGAIASALIYCFCVWSLLFGVQQLCFMVPLMTFPYLLYGADKVLEKKSPLIFIISLTYAGLSNFYFLYMLVVLAVSYVIFRYFINVRKFIIKDALIVAGKFILFGASAMMMSAVILLPAVMTMTSSSRYSADRNVPLLYQLKYYLRYLNGFTGNTQNGDWSVFGFTPMAFLAVVLMFTLKKRYTKVKICFIAMAATSLIPFGGFALNGFAYVCNRWSWGFALLAGYIVGLMIPEFGYINSKQKKVLAIAVLCYGIITSISFVSRTTDTRGITALLFLEVLVIIMMSASLDARKMQILICGLVFVGVFSNAYFRYSQYGMDQGMKEYLNFSEANKILKDTNADELTDEGEGFWRVEEYETPFERNSSAIRGAYTTNYYMSMTAPYVPNFIINNGLNVKRTYMFSNLNSRSILDALFSVGYAVVGKDGENEIPYGFTATGEYKDVDGDRVSVYVNENALPLGYTYDKWTSLDDYNKMTLAERQEAMLNGVVVENSTLEKTENTFESHSILKEIESNENVEVKDGKIYVKKDGTSAVLKVDQDFDNSELYLVLTGLNFNGASKRSQYTDEEWAELSPIEKVRVKASDKKADIDNSANIAFTYGDRYASINYMNHVNIYYCGQDDYIINMGYIKEDSSDQMRISFNKAGVYDFSSIDVVAQPMDSLSSKVAKLDEEHLENVKVGTNEITGNISVSKDKMLVVSVPYSTGWTAYVDGKEIEIKQANSLFMALELTKGDHDIKFVYRTPYMYEGAVLSCGGAVLFVLIMMYYGITRKRSAE